MAKKGEWKETGAKLTKIETSVIVSDEPNLDVVYQDIYDNINSLTLENAPKDYFDLKNQAKFLASIASKSFVLMGHRLKLIKDSREYEKEGYPDFKSFIEEEIPLGRTMVHHYVRIVEIFEENLKHVHSSEHDNLKVRSLSQAVSFAESHPEDRDDLFYKANTMSQREFIKYLKVHYSFLKEETEREEVEDIDGWYCSREELLSESKFLRDGMKPKTLNNMLKEILNLKMLEDPKNKTLEKMRKLLNTL